MKHNQKTIYECYILSITKVEHVRVSSVMENWKRAKSISTPGKIREFKNQWWKNIMEFYFRILMFYLVFFQATRTSIAFNMGHGKMRKNPENHGI